MFSTKRSILSGESLKWKSCVCVCSCSGTCDACLRPNRWHRWCNAGGKALSVHECSMKLWLLHCADIGGICYTNENVLWRGPCKLGGFRWVASHSEYVVWRGCRRIVKMFSSLQVCRNVQHEVQHCVACCGILCFLNDWLIDWVSLGVGRL